jgi:hypothetical protein
MTIETLWITLPTNEEDELKEVIDSIKKESLRDLNLTQLLSYFQRKRDCEQGSIANNSSYEEANKWQNILRNYSAIIEQKKPIIHLNTDTREILSRINSVKSKFREYGKSELAEKQFEPNELLCLIIMCYTNPTLIGPNLCQALQDNNQANIKKEMIENSAYNREQNRVLPFSSNLRLLSTALYFNDTNIRLPTSVINRVTTETIRDGLVVRKLDQRGGFEEWVNGTERSARNKRTIDAYAVLKSLKSHDTGEDHSLPPLDFSVSPSQISHSDNGTELTSEVLPLNSTHNAANSSYANGLIIASLIVLANNTLVGAVVRNIGKDLVTASKYVGSFFSRNVEPEAQQEEKAALLSPTAKS